MMKIDVIELVEMRQRMPASLVIRSLIRNLLFQTRLIVHCMDHDTDIPLSTNCSITKVQSEALFIQ